MSLGSELHLHFFTKKRTKGPATPRQHQPTQAYNSHASPPHPQYPYHTYTYSPRHSPSARPTLPNTHPPLYAPYPQASSSRGTAHAVVVSQARWQDSAGWSCVCIRSPGSSGCPLPSRGPRRRGSGWVRLPTVKNQYTKQSSTIR